MQQLQLLDASLYGATMDKPDLKTLYETIAALHKQGITQPGGTPKYALPPLYKH
jgi:hypothetical protein